jgi:hypothetical protein
MKAVRLLIPAATLIAAMMATSGLSFANKEIFKKEKKPCITCHVKMGQKDLNEVGKYYKEHKTLEGAPTPKK